MRYTKEYTEWGLSAWRLTQRIKYTKRRRLGGYLNIYTVSLYPYMENQ